MHKILNISDNYLGFGESAMTKSTSKGILYGRPYGGVVTLIKKSLVPHCVFKLINDRVVVVQIVTTLFINVYFPCDDGSILSYDQILDILSDVISIIIEDHKYEYLFLAGDLNCDLNSNRKNAELIKAFLTDFRMTF